MATWVTDSAGNRCSEEYFGSREAAQKALDGLVYCTDCTNCSDCSDCSRCSDCSDASPVEQGQEVPVIPNIHKAVYAAASGPNALQMDSWHTCETTHCRAGWVVTLAGKAGRKLEKRFDTLLAAMKIYDASDPTFKINPCRFFDSNEDALADMKALAQR